ncbi:hypothetical protein [Nocardia sp. IFM 10818]
MAKEALPQGHWGKITYTVLATDAKGKAIKVESRGNYGDVDGQTRRLGAYGSSPTAADKARQAKAKDPRRRAKVLGRNPISGWSRDMTVGEVLTTKWLPHHARTPHDRTNRPPTLQTMRQYRTAVQGSDNPGKNTVFLLRTRLARRKIGDPIDPVRPSEIDDALAEFTSATMRRYAKTALDGAFALAVKNDAADYNPVRDAARIERAGDAGDDGPRVLEDDEFTTYLRLEAEYFEAHPRADRDNVYRDAVLLHYNLATRIGQTLGVRIEDLAFDEDGVVITVAGTLVDGPIVDGGPDVLHWQAHEDGSTKDGRKSVRITDRGVVAMLKRRKMAAAPGQVLLFVGSGRREGKPVDPESLRITLRAIVAGSEISWVAGEFHAFRKAAANRVYDALIGQGCSDLEALDAVQHLLGHVEGSKVTRAHYLRKRVRGVADYGALLTAAPVKRSVSGQ